MKKIIVTIPAYNESKTIGRVLKGIKKVMEKQRYNYQIIVVNDGSTTIQKRLQRGKGQLW